MDNAIAGRVAIDPTPIKQVPPELELSIVAYSLNSDFRNKIRRTPIDPNPNNRIKPIQ